MYLTLFSLVFISYLILLIHSIIDVKNTPKARRHQQKRKKKDYWSQF